MKSKKRAEKNSLSLISRVVLGVIFIGILTAMYIDHYNNFKTRLNLQNIMENPEKYNGVYYQTMGRIIQTERDFFYVLDTESNKEVPVFLPNHNIMKGSHIVVYGPFTKDGYMIAAKLRLQNPEPFKYIVSGLSSFYVLWLFFKEWKLTKEGFVERVKCRIG